jgi:hypothetical protein
MTRHKFLVELELPVGVTAAAMVSYVARAVSCWRASSNPSEPIFHLNPANIAVSDITGPVPAVRRYTATLVGSKGSMEHFGGPTDDFEAINRARPPREVNHKPRRAVIIRWNPDGTSKVVRIWSADGWIKQGEKP